VTKTVTKTKPIVSVRPEVDRRGEPRLKAAQPVMAQALPTGRRWEACILDLSVAGARLRSSEPIPPGTEVRLDAKGVLLDATVTRCEPEDGAYNVGMKLLRPLTLLTELERLNAALLRDDSA
jgi:hypothetical protein